MELSTAILFAKDLERMLAFYRDALGLVVRETREGFVVLDAGGASVSLHAIPAHIASTIEIADPPRRRSETPIKLVFAADDLEAERARLIARGAVVSEPTAWGTCDLLDPEGNVLQIRATTTAA